MVNSLPHQQLRTDPSATAAAAEQPMPTAASQAFATMTAQQAANKLIAFDPAGQPQVSAAMRADFERLPAEQQQKFLARLLTSAMSADPELATALMVVVGGLAKGGVASAIQPQFDALDRRLGGLPAGDIPARISTPEVRDARARLMSGAPTTQDIALLKGSGVTDLLPAERGALMLLLARDRDAQGVLDVLTGAPSVDSAYRTLSGFSGGEAHQGLRNIQNRAEGTGDLTRHFDRAFAEVKLKQSAVPSAARRAANEAFRIGMDQPGPPPAPPAASGTPANTVADEAPAADSSSTAAEKPFELKTMSRAEAAAKYASVNAQLSADGTLTIDNQLILVETALDPDGLYQRILHGDPELIEALKDDPGLMERVKTVMSAMNAAKDALIAIADDTNSRRKKHAESMSRV